MTDDASPLAASHALKKKIHEHPDAFANLQALTWFVKLDDGRVSLTAALPHDTELCNLADNAFEVLGIPVSHSSRKRIVDQDTALTMAKAGFNAPAFEALLRLTRRDTGRAQG